MIESFYARFEPLAMYRQEHTRKILEKAGIRAISMREPGMPVDLSEIFNFTLLGQNPDPELLSAYESGLLGQPEF